MSPLDVRKQEFRRVLRGFDTDEVHAFLETVADELESVLTDNQQLRTEVGDLDEKVTEYRNLEQSLRETLLTAERVMNEARQNARKEAELILREAVGQAQEQAGELSSKVENLKLELRDLRADRDEFLERLHSLARAEMQRVETYKKDSQQDDSRKIGTPAVEPVEQLVGERNGPTARELWRDYSLSQVARSEPPEPVDTGIDLLDSVLDESGAGEGEHDRGGGDAHSPQEVDRIAAAMVDMSRDRSAAPGQGTSSATKQVTEPVDQDHDGSVEPQPGRSGHDPETVATFPNSVAENVAPQVDRAFGTGEQPVEPEDALGNRSKELPERVADSGPPRWSLSRFTRVLSKF
jgi:cell division initiation protein